MTDFQTGQVVTVKPLRLLRKIVAIEGNRALCASLTNKSQDWFAFSDLEPNDRRPITVRF